MEVDIDREDLRSGEIEVPRRLADETFALDESGLEAMLANATISEVDCDG